MMTRITALAVSALAAAALAPAASAAPLSKAVRFQTRGGNVTCGIEIHSPGKATKVLCAARGIPAPKQPGVGDPGFVQIGVLGNPRTVRTSQNSFVAGQVVTLSRGRLWNQLGVTCHVGLVKVLCFNGDNHGFVIGGDQYTSF